MSPNPETPDKEDTQFSVVRQKLGFDVEGDGDRNDNDKPQFSPGNPFTTTDYIPKCKHSTSNPFGTKQTFGNIRIVSTPMIPEERYADELGSTKKTGKQEISSAI